MRPSILRRRLRGFFHNPTDGIEYNKFSDNQKTSRHIYDVDVARNPRIVKDSKYGYIFANVQELADKANSENTLINSQRKLVEWSR